MHPILRNILAVIAGLVGGSIVNMTLVNLSGSIIPYPEGVDVSDFENLKASMPLFGPEHFIMPFLAHALGTFAGAWIAAKLCATRPMGMAMIIGIFFLFGGIMAVSMIPAPMWFNVTDLLLAYIPMAWLGGKAAAPKAVA